MTAGTEQLKEAFRDFETSGIPATGPNEPDKAEIRAALDRLSVDIGAAQAGIHIEPSLASRDAYYAVAENQGNLVYVNNNNGSATDPANGVYEYVIGAARLAQSFYAGVASVVQPLVDQATTAAATSQTLVDNAYDIQSEFGRGPDRINLFVRNKATADQAISAGGTTGASTGFTLSDSMRVKPSTQVYVSALGAVSYRSLDSAGVYVAGSYGTLTAGGGAVALPATARYFQISTPTNSLTRLMVSPGSTAPATYIEPGFYDPMTARRLMLSTSIGAMARAFGQWNLFIQADALDDYGMGSTGIPYAFPGNNASVTGFIDVPPGGQIVSNTATNTNAAAFYDVDGLYLSSVTVAAGVAINVPAGASKFRQQFPTTGKGTLVIAWGATLPSAYITSPVIEGGLQKRNSLKATRKSLDLASRAPRNLFNPGDTIDDFAISNTGVLYASTGRYTTGFIEVTGGVPHLSNYSSQSTFVCYYDENFSIINSGTSYAITLNVPFVPPTGAYWMRRTVNRASGSIGYDSRTDCYVYPGAYATGTVGIAAGNASAGDTVTIGTNTITFVASGATGAQVNIGAANVNTAANLLAYINANSGTLGATAALTTAPNTVRISSTGIGPSANIALSKTGANVVVSGATLTGAQPVSLALNRFGSGGGSQPQNWAGKTAYIHGDSQTNNGTYQPRVAATTGLAITSQGTPGRGMNAAATAIATVDLSSYDLVINNHMTNDLNIGSTIGTIADDYTVNSFYGNMERWLRNVIGPGRYPTKRVVFIGAPGRTDMTTNGLGNTLKDYNDAMRAFCAKWGIPFLDLLSTAGFNSLTFASGGAWTTDGLHYNILGGDIIGRLVGNFINQKA